MQSQNSLACTSRCERNYSEMAEPGAPPWSNTGLGDVNMDKMSESVLMWISFEVLGSIGAAMGKILSSSLSGRAISSFHM